MKEPIAVLKGAVVSVAVEGVLYSFDKLYDYFVPLELADYIRVGMRVLVPFGKSNRKQVAMVMLIQREVFHPDKVKRIVRILDDEPALSQEMLNLATWLKENTFCNYYDAIRTMLPTGLAFDVQEKYGLNKSEHDVQLSFEEDNLLTALKNAKSQREFDRLLEVDNEQKETLVKALIDKKVIISTENIRKRVNDETLWMAELSPAYLQDSSNFNLTPKHKKVVELLEEAGSAAFKEIAYGANVTTTLIKNMVKKGVLEAYQQVLSRADVYDDVVENPDDIALSEAQQRVFDGLCDLQNSDEAKAALLRGITGSGKTSIFIKLIQKAINENKTAILLVPEIGLTPQMVGKFRRLFGPLVALMHSNLSLGQRADEYKRIKSGEAKIVIGTRSAIFAPFENIGIIIIDEEGEHSYKSEKSPRYHARDVAKQRCFHHKALLLLASATPTIESYYYANTGRYALFELDERYNNAVLPDVYMVDMKVEAEQGNRSNFSETLIEELRRNLENGEQSLLLLNRRGFYTHISCLSCGNIEVCLTCELPLTYHKINNTIACHYCGYTRDYSTACSKCGGEMLKNTGTGTQRIEEEIAEYFPNARLLRMDADTTMTKNAFDIKFSAFSRGEYDIMIGTQMIAKGLDFPNVTLVGVLMIDKALYSGDFLGYERTFSLITQVVGRSGRGEKRGRAYLQTFSPDHYVLNLAAVQNYKGFYDEEIEIRKALIFPPFCSICVIGFSALSEQACLNAATVFSKILVQVMKQKENSDKKMPLRVLGPAKSVAWKVNGRFRYRLILKCKNTKLFRQMIDDAIKLTNTADYHKYFTNVSFYVDMNGETS